MAKDNTTRIGLGTYKLADPATTVATALDMGYRLIDTATVYGNEAEVGRAVRNSATPREDIQVTSKLRGSDQGRQARTAVEHSLRATGLDYLDAYLIHWPLPELNLYLHSYEQLLYAREDDLILQVGVSNFLPEHLEAIHREFGEYPAVNQVELHPYFPQAEQVEFHQDHGIATQGWSPLGRKTDLLAEPLVQRLAATHECTAGQVLLAWQLARGITPLPKSDRPARLAENLAAANVPLSEPDVASLMDMERGRIGGDPATFMEM